MKFYINKYLWKIRIVPSSIESLNLDYHIEQQLSFYSDYDNNLILYNSVTIHFDKNDEIEFTYKEFKKNPYLYNKIEIFILINKIFKQIKKTLINIETNESIIKQLNEIEKIIKLIKIKKKINIEKDIEEILILKEYISFKNTTKNKIKFYKCGKRETPVILINDILAYFINKNIFILATWERSSEDMLITEDIYQFLFNNKFQKFINQSFEEKKEKILRKIKKRKNEIKLNNNEIVALIFNDHIINIQKQLLN